MGQNRELAATIQRFLWGLVRARKQGNSRFSLFYWGFRESKRGRKTSPLVNRTFRIQLCRNVSTANNMG